MKSKWNIGLIVIVVIILLAILIFGGTDKLIPPKEKKIVLPEPTANVDSTIDALLKLVENEADILGSQEIDSSLIDSEIQEFNDFGNIYNEQEI